MGNTSVSPMAAICNELQQQLLSERLREKDSDSSSNTKVNVLPRSMKVDGRFVLSKEQFPTYVEQNTFSHILEWSADVDPYPSYTMEFLNEHLPVMRPDKDLLETGAPEGSMQITWLGHASVLSQFDGWHILADPIFSERCSPIQWAGPKRLRPAPIDTKSLPRIDICVISHNHYDHLDETTVRELLQYQPDMIFAVPLGMRRWLEKVGATNIIEMDWSEVAELRDHTDKQRPPVRIRCVPCQHWCSRTHCDYNQCLWSSWAVSTLNGSFFFGGDTGYCPIFKKVGEVIPDIVVAALPIGAYGSDKEKWFHKHNHMNPAEAVLTHLDLGADSSVAMHWGTFTLTREDIMEPPQLLEKAKRDHNLGIDSFVVLQHGESRIFNLKSRNTAK